jgi:hypothetical protein
MRSEILALQRRLGLAVLSVTHKQAEPLTMSDRIVPIHGAGWSRSTRHPDRCSAREPVRCGLRRRDLFIEGIATASMPVQGWIRVAGGPELTYP